MKRLVAFLCVLLLMLPMSMAAVSPVPPGEIEVLRYDNASTIGLSLTFSGTLASCEGTVTGKTGTTNISATLTLERVNADGTRTFIYSWSNSSESKFLRVAGERYVTRGYKYRLTIDTVVTKNGVDERITDYVEKSCS